jgi:hypothetical protein
MMRTREYSYLEFRPSSTCRSASAPKSWSALARARAPVPNPANPSRHAVRERRAIQIQRDGCA